MIWTNENMKAVQVIKQYLDNLGCNEERNHLIATEIVKELDRHGLFFMMKD